jgi:glyoxylase-like metal-dependent hydrolase (beta-lactamase superfamily II)
MYFALATVIYLSMAGSVLEASQTSAAGEARIITNIRGGLYVLHDGEQVTVFLVTPDGIVIVDPLSLPTALWLKEELARRFPGAPVKYVLHTQHRFDRASGALAFYPTATIIAHERFNEERNRAAGVLPPALIALDANHNGRLESAELIPSPSANMIRALDVNRDSAITPSELYSRVSPVARTFARQQTITLGGQSIELWSTPALDALDMTAIVFPSERIAFAVDLFPARAIPERIGPVAVKTTIASLRTVEGLNFDTLITGLGTTQTKSDLVAFREYLETLNAGVRAAFDAGSPLANVQDTLTLPQYQQWGNYQTGRRQNIAEVYRALRTQTVEVFAAGTYGFGALAPIYDVCRPNGPCTVDDVSSQNALVAGRYTFGRFGGGAEIRFQRPVTLYGLYLSAGAVTVREQDRIVAFPVTYTLNAGRRLSATMEVGPAFVFTRTRTQYVESAYINETKDTSFGFTGGAVIRIPLSGRVRVVVPAHFVSGSPDIVKSRVVVGVGLSVGISRAVF